MLCLGLEVKHLKIRMWFTFIALALMLVRIFAPISEPLEKILLAVAIVILLVLAGTFYWQDWRYKRLAGRSSSASISSSD